jgi:hypothetical protein
VLRTALYRLTINAYFYYSNIIKDLLCELKAKIALYNLKEY